MGKQLPTLRITLLTLIVLASVSFCNISSAQTVQTFTASGTWLCPIGVTSVTVQTWGGGGAGGGVTTKDDGGGGGGGGAYNTGVQVVTPGLPYNYIVGLGGTGSFGNGTAGGVSSFNALTPANGGAGGGVGPSGTAGAGGAAGVNSGGNGATGLANTRSGGGGGGAGSGGPGGAALGTAAGAGGLVDGGNGGAGFTTTAAGALGTIIGGGGSGAYTTTPANSNGGGGARGQVRITYTLPPCAAPLTQPTALLLTPASTSIAGSFTAAAGTDGYIVIRTATAAQPTGPVNGTTYTTGAGAGGFVESTSTTTTFNSTGLSMGTQYWYWIYSYRNVCTGSIMYNTVSPLTGNATTLICGILTNTATLTAAGTLNWSALSWSLGHLPIACENAELILNIASAGADVTTVTLDVDVTVYNFKMTNSSTNADSKKVLATTGGVTFTVLNDMTITSPGAHKFNRTSFANTSNTVINGNLILGQTVPGATDGHAAIGSAGTTPNQTFTIYGNMFFNPRGYTTDEWTRFIFDKAGTQYIYNNTLATDTIQAVLFENLIIGNLNASTVIMGGTTPDAYMELQGRAGVTIGVNSTLVLPANFSLNIISPGLPSYFRMSAGSRLQIGGDKSITGAFGVPGSNFPGGFSPYTLNAASTIEYNGASSITQTVFSGLTYANLEVTNSSGSGRAQKNTTGAVTAGGNITINALADLTLGAAITGSGPFNVVSTGGLYCAANIVSGANNFNLNSGAFLGIGHAQGISVLGSATGNVQMTTARNFSTSANYIYNGAVNQITGNGLPSICNDLSIANTAVNGTVTIASNQLINGVHLLQQGTFDIGTIKVAINGTGTINRTAGFMKANRGMLEMRGTSGTAQSLSGSWFTGRNISTLINSNTTGITLAATANDTLLISSALLYGSGTGNSLITTNDNLTLLSRDTATARFGEIITGSGNSIAGKVNVERYISSGRKWRHLSVPSNSVQTARDSWMEGNMTPNGNLTLGYGCIVTDEKTTWSANNFDSRSVSGPSVKYYVPATNAYVGIPNTTVYQMNSQSAYFNYVRGDRSALPAPVTLSPTVLRTKGTLNMGNQVVSIPATQFAAIGNPYASAIDIRRLDTAGLGGIFYVWDPKLTGVWGLGAYQTLYQSGSEYRIIPGGGSYGPLNSFTDTLESGQAFFVRAVSSPGTLTFKESAKNIGARTMSFAGTEESAFCLLSITDPGGNALVDGAMAAFGAGYDNAVGYGDALKMANTSENVSFKRDGNLLVIERRAKNPGNDTLFLNMTGMRVRQYQWDILIENMMAAGRSARFIDKYLSTSAPLVLDSNNPILFNVENTTGSYAADRFMIVFTQAAVVPVRFTGISAVRNPDKTVTVKWHTDNEINMKDYTVEHSADGITFAGIGIRSASTGSGGRASYSYQHANALAGVNYYRVKGTGINGGVQYTSIVKVSPLGGNNDISIYPNPVKDKKINLVFDKNLFGSYRIEIINNIGQKLYSEKAELQINNVIRTIFLHPNTPAGIYNVTLTDKDLKTITKSIILL